MSSIQAGELRRSCESLLLHGKLQLLLLLLLLLLQAVCKVRLREPCRTTKAAVTGMSRHMPVVHQLFGRRALNSI